MANLNASTQLSPKQSALLRLLKATTTLPAQITFYASALGAIALMAGGNLPTGLATLAAGVGVNTLSSILERVARGDDIMDSEILEHIKAAVEDSHIAEKLAMRDTQILIARLFRRHDLLRSAIQSHEYVVLQRITEQAQSYEAFVSELRDDISALYILSSSIYVELQTSNQQNDEILNIARDMRDQLGSLRGLAMVASRPGSAPPLPTLVVGREDALIDLKARLGVTKSGQVTTSIQILTAIRGWPGIGKTTIAAALAHDPEIATAFPDGVLWVSLGQNPSVLSELATWGRALGIDDLLRAHTVEEASTQLTALLRTKHMLLIVDDVWEPEHAAPFKVGGRGCALLITTRINSVAQALAPTPNDIYKLAVLNDGKALDLLHLLAPTVVTEFREQCLELVHELEGLPLALQVAGHMLNAEAAYGFGVKELLTELRDGAKKYEGTKLLAAKAPADRADLSSETTPTVAILLQKSTERLDEEVRDCFAYLGAFAPKPATFDLAAMKAVWGKDDPKPIARTLVDRGLLEFIPEMSRYQMHALVVMHARSLLTDD